MMEAIENQQANNIVYAEQFLRDMVDDEEKQEPELMLPVPKRDYLPKRGHMNLGDFNSSKSSFSHNNSYTSAPALISRQSSSGWSISLWKNPFSKSVDQSINLMDTSLARYSSGIESTPMGGGTMPNVVGMEDVYLDETSRRGGLRRKGGINGPFYDGANSKDARRRSILMLSLIGFVLVSVGLAVTTNFFLQKQPKAVSHVIVGSNSSSFDIGVDDDVMEATLKEALDVEEQAITEEIAAVEWKEDHADTTKEKETLKEEVTILGVLQETIQEEEEVVEEKDNAISEQDKLLLEKEQENLSHQQENLAQEANLLDLEQSAETPADAKKLWQEAKKLDIVEQKLEVEQQVILKKEAKVEGWDYEKAKAVAEEREVKEGKKGWDYDTAAEAEAREAKEAEEEENASDRVGGR